MPDGPSTNERLPIYLRRRPLSRSANNSQNNLLPSGPTGGHPTGCVDSGENQGIDKGRLLASSAGGLVDLSSSRRPESYLDTAQGRYEALRSTRVAGRRTSPAPSTPGSSGTSSLSPTNASSASSEWSADSFSTALLDSVASGSSMRSGPSPSLAPSGLPASNASSTSTGADMPFLTPCEEEDEQPLSRPRSATSSIDLPSPPLLSMAHVAELDAASVPEYPLSNGQSSPRGTKVLLQHLAAIQHDPTSAARHLRELQTDPNAVAMAFDEPARPGLPLLLSLAERLSRAEADVSTPGTDGNWTERRPTYHTQPSAGSSVTEMGSTPSSPMARPKLARAISLGSSLPSLSGSFSTGSPRRPDGVTFTPRSFTSHGPATPTMASVGAFRPKRPSLSSSDSEPFSEPSSPNSRHYRGFQSAAHLASGSPVSILRGGFQAREDDHDASPLSRSASVVTTADEQEQIRRLKVSIKAIAKVLRALRNGDLEQMIEQDMPTSDLESLKDDVNSLVRRLRRFTLQVTSVTTDVGQKGLLGRQAELDEATGIWKKVLVDVNSLANSLSESVRSISSVTSAIARGDFSQHIEVQAAGEMADLKAVVNDMVEKLRVIVEQVSNVAREVGTEGNLGGQAIVPNVEGAWADLTQHVNQMASNLTEQVRQISATTKAVASGDLSKQVTVQARGEVAELASTVNGMVAFLQVFAAEVTRVALLTGTEGVLGGKAEVQGVSGEWKTLVDHVNGMAQNLTDQVRSIARVTTAVANGDLTSFVEVEARGEIGQLKVTINSMVTLLQTFVSEMSRVTNEVGTQGKLGGSVNVANAKGEWSKIVKGLNRMVDRVTKQVRAIGHSTTAVSRGDLSQRVEIDAEGEILQLAETINAMLNKLHVFFSETVRIAQAISEGNLQVQAEVHAVEGVWAQIVTEVNKMSTTLSSQVSQFQAITDAAASGDFTQMTELTAKGGFKVLQRNIDTMVVKLRTAFESNVTAKIAAENHSRAKSQFLANTSHEIRTPLNAIIGLTWDTLGTTLSRAQRENLNLVRGQADALLRIISDILDVTKIEANRLILDSTPFSLREVIFEALTSLAFGAGKKNLEVFLDIDPAVPDVVVGDGSRLAQVVKNLVGNAQKFTEVGSITLTARLKETIATGWRLEFHVVDTGIGIPEDQLVRIFDSFMQADGSEKRKYGGTGLGLTISRNLVQLMGGQLTVSSISGQGSDFTFDPVLHRADPKSELTRQLSNVSPGQNVVVVDGAGSDGVEEYCKQFGFRVTRVANVNEVPTGDLFDCGVISTTEEADTLRGSRFLPLVLRAERLPKLNMRRALDLSLASVIETNKTAAELCAAILRASAKSMRGIKQQRGQADWKILLAEDNPINQVVAKRILTHHGVKDITIVENGALAVEAVKNNVYSVVLMDVSMPVKDGREATRDIRAWETTYHAHPIPVIGVTAHALVGDHENCLEAGMTAVCTKPLNAAELLATMGKVIAQYQERSGTLPPRSGGT